MMPLTKADLTPVCAELFRQAMKELPDEVASRLTCGRAVRNHGSYRTVLLFNTWDIHQSDVLPRDHFTYCLGYDPMRLISGGTDWYFHLWLNTVRIYRKRAEVKVILERDLRKHCPRPFFFDIGDRHVQAKMMFNLKGDAEKLIPFLKPHYVKLIEVMHPLLMPVIDKFSVHGTRAEVKTEVATRGRIAVKPVRTSRPDLVREYSRSVPPGWREEILIAFGHRCAHCGADLRQTEYHMDHIIPFSKEGTTTKKNLQPLCATCNLAKGNRHTG